MLEGGGGGCQQTDVDGVDTLQAADHPYSVKNGPRKLYGQNFSKWGTTS